MRRAMLLSVLAAGALAGLSSPAVAKKRAVPRKPIPVKGVVNINQAPLKKLVLLPYVGRSRAVAIVKYRAKRKFAKPEDLMKVKGFGKRTFKRVQRHVSVTGPTTIQKIRNGGKGSRTNRKGKGGRSNGNGKRRRSPRK